MRSNPHPSTLALCVIGDEILSGKTLDTNSAYLAKVALKVGLDLREVSVIRDDQPAIMEAIGRLSALYDVVITSGGLGPTHDDVTYASVAKAFNKDLVFESLIAQRIKDINHISELNKGQTIMCTVPFPYDEILFTEGLWQPTIEIKNVLMLPGVPGLFTRMLDNWLDKKANSYSLCPRRRVGMKTTMKESFVSETLDKYHIMLETLGCTLGSYPKKDFQNHNSWVELSITVPLLNDTDNSKLQSIIEEMKVEYDAEALCYED